VASMELHGFDADFVKRLHKYVLSQLSDHMDRKVIIIDDNMYYESMRHQYYQLARTCENLQPSRISSKESWFQTTLAFFKCFFHVTWILLWKEMLFVTVKCLLTS
jgi:hypothetical protein